MEKAIPTMEENLIINRFRELSDDGKHKLLHYVETLYNEEKSTKITESPEDFLSDQERESVRKLIDEFVKSEPTAEGIKALQELFSGIFECDKEIPEKHDFYLYNVDLLNGTDHDENQ